MIIMVTISQYSGNLSKRLSEQDKFQKWQILENWEIVISFFISKICKVIRLEYCLYFKKIRTLKILLKHNLFIVNC